MSQQQTESASAGAAGTDWKLAAPGEYARALFAADLRPAGCRDAAVVGEVTRGCFGGGGGSGGGGGTSVIGSACATVGRTVFACGVTASLVDRGAAETAAAAGGAECHPLVAAGVVFNADLPPLCSPAIRPGPPGDLAQALTVQVSDALAQSGCLDYERLNVGPRHRLQLHVDAVCLSADGSLADACLLAASAALQDARLPRLSVSADDSGRVVRHGDGGRCEPLQLLRGGGCVLCSSFALVGGRVGQRLLPAPNQLEEALQGVGVVRVFTAGGGVGDGDGASEIRVVSLLKIGGGGAVTPELLADCCRAAVARHGAALAGPLAW